MKNIISTALFLLLVSSFAYANETLTSVSDKYCGSFFSGSFSDDGGQTWKDVKPKRICRISKDHIKFVGGTAESIKSVEKAVINNSEKIVIRGDSGSTYIISAAKEYYMIITVIKGKEVVRFLCMKE